MVEPWDRWPCATGVPACCPLQKIRSRKNLSCRSSPPILSSIFDVISCLLPLSAPLTVPNDCRRSIYPLTVPVAFLSLSWISDNVNCLCSLSDLCPSPSYSHSRQQAFRNELQFIRDFRSRRWCSCLLPTHAHANQYLVYILEC